jgi:hypothetical protein
MQNENNYIMIKDKNRGTSSYLRNFKSQQK